MAIIFLENLIVKAAAGRDTVLQAMLAILFWRAEPEQDTFFTCVSQCACREQDSHCHDE